MYLLWDGYWECTEKEAYMEKREKPEPAGNFVDKPIYYWYNRQAFKIYLFQKNFRRIPEPRARD